jgi:hypothetical protein
MQYSVPWCAVLLLLLIISSRAWHGIKLFASLVPYREMALSLLIDVFIMWHAGVQANLLWHLRPHL